MADTETIKCYVKSTKKLQNLTITIDGKGIEAQTNKKGIAEFELDIPTNALAKHIYFSINSSDYMLTNENHCVPAHHRKSKQAFDLALIAKQNVKSIKIYKKEQIIQDNHVIEQEKEILATQITKDTQPSQTNPNQSSNTNNQDSNPPPQIIFLEVNLTQANA
ncbi:hypothetical protein CQA53_10320, partial [Helicobacter didelphidarum]